MLSRLLLVFTCLVITACSGNSSSKVSVPDTNLKRFSGVVNNSSVYGASVSVIPVGNHGQFRLNSENLVDATSLSSDDRGRYGLLVDTDEDGAFVISVNAPNADTEAEIQPDSARMQCQVVAGCMVSGDVVNFGSFYPMQYNSQWSAAVEFISDGQFVVVNPITEMATILGFSTYVNSPNDTGVSIGTIAAPGYYSSYGVVRGNSQVASLIGLTDIISVEPINLTSLHDIAINSSTSLQDSIRYGALVAAWQELELKYNSSIAAGDFNFQQEVIFEFINNKSLNQEGQYIQGQLYQAEPLNEQKLSMKAWYTAAAENLAAARDYHASLARTVPNEVNLVIAKLEQEVSNFQDGVLTTAAPKINEDIKVDYVDAVAKSKAMVNYVSDLANNFADEEYRNSVQAASDLATEEVRRLSPKLDVLMQQLLTIQEYYLSCTHGSCDEASIWHSAGNVFNGEKKTLLVVQSEGIKLEVGQEKVFTDAAPEGSEKTNTHDLLLTGAIEFEGVRFELGDLEREGQNSIESGIRFSYRTALPELPELPELVPNGKGARVDETLVPDAIELALPSFKFYDTATESTKKELVFSGAISALMVANVDANDFSDDISPVDKMGKRYNLADISATLNIAGVSQGMLEDGTELRDNAVINFQAVASEAVANENNLAAYFPDTVYPTFESFFKPREGFSVGKESADNLVVSRRGVMDFPKLNSNGEFDESGLTVEVNYLELDYEIGGLERYVVYPKIGDDETFWGLICSAIPSDEEDLNGREWTKEEEDSEGNVVTRALLTCSVRDKFSGIANADSFINSVYAINKDVVNLREYNGQGAYRISYPTEVNIQDGKEVESLKAFSPNEKAYKGKIEQSIVLGVDSMRLQFQPRFVNDSASAFLPDTAFDVSLIWRQHDLIDINVFLAYNADENYNNPDGSGLPYLGVGSDVESYSVAYQTNEHGDEVGVFVFAWSGVQFVDGPIDGEKVMQRTSDENLKEGFIAGIGSNVEYRSYSAREKEALGLSDSELDDLKVEKCGFLGRGQETEGGENCTAIAYLTFRGLVTGVLREERDGAYVIRYIDGTWQVLGG